MSRLGTGGPYRQLYRLLEWAGRLAGLNVVWLLGVLAGFVLGGLAPATVAAAAVVRAHLVGQPVPLWSGFWRYWRAELRRSQVRLGIPILTVWVIVFYVLAARHSPLGIGLGVVGVGYLATLVHLPGVLAHVELSAQDAWLVTLHVAWSRPLGTLALAAGTILAVTAVVFWVPAALPFAFPSVPLAVATWLGLRSPVLAGGRGEGGGTVTGVGRRG
ncbi:DUF624 domain-containing protein [Actinopolymorpha pittospori]|uniref:Membrane protein YesL n=1 Tax=Actinopolymorpha pittospori TaxID=648752 RepID=A0A927N7U1_9ACTN|nr:DUF624 domain-containing protein [Actinopolymorpha pittospori]MBE1613237.1 putative membrane protein YesL [Actinopolymorpha pittospori]